AGDNSGKAVVDDHKDQYGDQRGHDRNGSLANGFQPERGTGDFFTDGILCQFRRKLSRVQNLNDVVNLSFFHIAGDLAAAGNAAIDTGSGDESLVEHDSQVSLLTAGGDVCTRKLAEPLRAFRIEGKFDFR